MIMEYMSCPEAAKKWGISERRVQILCSENADTINKQINLTTTVSGVVASYAVKLYS